MNRNLIRFWILTGLLIMPGLSSLVGAETDPVPDAGSLSAAGTNAALSGSELRRLAKWQHHLTLGPGDLLNVSLFEMPESAQREVPIGPDGRITFLQARDIVASGLTVDELRAKLDSALGKFYQNPRTIVTPAAIRSKKYYVLGAVVNSGVYNLDRPLTIIEGLARAGGLETGIYDRNTVELADLAHSFLVRNGERLPLDFEQLFQHGDLSQNIPLEPEDYLYVAMASANEIYVLGEVNSPGTAAFLPRVTVIGAIAARGGFSVRAYKTRVLVVRGSLNRPESFVINTDEILSAKRPDFKLQSKDIIYISQSPWVRAEEILDAAVTAFVQGFVVSVTTRKVGPFFDPLVK
ncbi:MAG TPA: polysaccharide biosynthesis/export family protein [Candidatus Limnocylindrales bacterium]|nr:polysaccharide biosynthesis/export family protein [Candidatus Limnocylindrales bacterium]